MAPGALFLLVGMCLAWAAQYGVWRVCVQAVAVGASEGEEERLLLDEHEDSDQGD